MDSAPSYGMMPFKIFDGHNDALLRLHARGEPRAVETFLEGGAAGHLDLPRGTSAGFAGGFFAIFTPSDEAPEPGRQRPPVPDFTSGAVDLAEQPPTCSEASARDATLSMAALLFRIEAGSKGRFKVCRNSADLETCLSRGVTAAILHIEGAEAIDPDLYMLDVLHQAGLRSIGPVWSRPNIFATGVPFRFPSSPDIGPGLTDAGFALVKACNRLKIMIDLSHLNERGFWDVAQTSDAPLVATHSNAHAVCAHSRNLTDRQLAAIRESRGMVGLNFAVSFLRPDGRKDADTPLEVLLRHLDHLIAHLGEDHVGLGSDFDGALIPNEIGSVSGLPRLIQAMRDHGYEERLMRKLCHENWLRVLERTWN